MCVCVYTYIHIYMHECRGSQIVDRGLPSRPVLGGGFSLLLFMSPVE